MNPTRLLLAALAVAALAATPALATDNCKPTFKVTNAKVTSIKVTAIEYRLKGTNSWQREGVTNHVLTKNDSHTWSTQSLGKADIGDHIDVRAVFQNDTGRGYGNDVASSAAIYSSVACDKGKLYAITVR